jgi:signal transduction histidine kinase
MARSGTRFRFQLIHICFAAAFAVVMIAIVIITGLSAHRQDAQSLATQRIVAGYDAEDAYLYLRGQVRLMVYWQDSFVNIVKKWDQKWVTYQFDTYEESMGNRYTALIGPNREIRFLHAPHGETTLNPEYFRHASGLNALLDKVSKSGVRQPPEMANGVIVSGGKPYFAVAAPVTPEEKADLPAANRTPFYAIFLNPVEVEKFADLSTGFSATSAFVTLDGSQSDGYQQFALTDASGKPVAWLKWKPHLPGSDFMRQVTIPLGIVLFVFVLTQLIVAGRWLALQRNAMQAQAEARAAHEQSRLKSVFLGTISHELRTPLNAIIGYADTLSCQIFGPLGSPRNGEYVRDIRSAGRDLLKTVNDLIEIARIEAGDKCADEKSFDVADVARKAIHSLHERIQEKSLRVSLVRTDRAAICRGSPTSLAQAIERILSNAVRHSPNGGPITIDITARKSSIVIEIQDRGEGIPPERLEDLKRPFGHPDNHLIAVGKGLAFGIPIAKGLIELMGGTFEIESTPGAGTTVRMILPAADDAALSPPTQNVSVQESIRERAAGNSR